MTGAEFEVIQAGILDGLGGWKAIIVLATLMGAISIVHKSIDAWSASRRARLDLEKEYLQQMVSDIEEIKRRLGSLGR